MSSMNKTPTITSIKPTAPPATFHAPIHGLVKKDAGGSFEGQDVTIKGNFAVDANALLKVLPAGTRIISAQTFGTSAWTATGRMDTILADGTPKSYFVKCATGELGESMMVGEFTAMREILKVMPDFGPVAHAWGKYTDSSTDIYYLLSDFIDMEMHDISLPDPDEFCSKIAEMHRKGKSPNGKFGFWTTTYHGRFPRFNDGWYDNWADFMAQAVAGIIAYDQEYTGEWPELVAVGQRVVSHVIPRLIGALQSGGRSIEPCLVHADLWEGNIGTDMDTGELKIYDAGAFFAHHEFELGHWRCERHRISSKLFRRTYLKYFPADDPVEEFDDRNRLYSLGSNIMYAIQVPGAIERMVAYNDLCYLVEKYAPLEGLGKYDPAKDPTIAMWR